jgi:hypothetical protein
MTADQFIWNHRKFTHCNSMGNLRTNQMGHPVNAKDIIAVGATHNGIDCRYCHTSVETSAFAGIPPTKTCMNCHSQIFSNSPFLEPVRASFRDNVSIEWTRVHDLPDFVYFNHSIHVAKGVGCSTCHGAWTAILAAVLFAELHDLFLKIDVRA